MRSRLLAVAIAASLGVSSFAATAAPGPQSTNTASSSEIALLKEQLASLQAKVDSLEQRSNDQAQSAQAAPVAASVDTRLAKLEKITNNTSISGKMYFDFTSISQKNSDTGKTSKSGVGTDVKRFYFTVDHKFNDIWSANLTTDFNYVSSDGETNLFVKKAYVEGKFDPAFKLRIGSADMPWIPFVEGYYGFRYVENTLTDRLKYGNSADWGLHASGDMAGKTLNYAVSVVNGNGYKNPSRSKGVDVEGRVGFAPIKGMIVAVGGYSGNRGKRFENVTTPHTAQRADAMVAFANKNFRLGAEYFTAKNWNNVLSPLGDKADGYSVWGSLAVADNITLFARYDNSSLSKQQDHAAKDKYYNAGVQFAVTKGFLVSAVYKHEKGDRSVTDPMLPPHVQSIKTDEIGVFGEVKF